MTGRKWTYRLAKWRGAILLLLLFLLPSISSAHAESFPPRIRLSVLPLDLSRSPSTEEIMAAGQLGGPLHPTEDIDLGKAPGKRSPAAMTQAETNNIERNKAINLSFGRAIQKWNRHEYREAVCLFRKHTEDYPDSPWVSEAILHVGCDATYQGRYTEAEESFTWIIESNRGKTHHGAKKLVNKARLRLAGLKFSQNNFDEARRVFGELLGNSDDWRERTYATHWLQRLSRYSGSKLSMLNCGALALAHLLERDGREKEAREVSGFLPGSAMGHSMKDLEKMARDYGYEFVGLKMSAEDIREAPLPAIIQISGDGQGLSGHYWVLEKTDGAFLEFFDPQAGRRYTQSISEFAREWDGNGLVLQQRGESPRIGQRIPNEQLETYFGGCCGAPPPPSDLGDPGGDGGGDDCPNCCNGLACKDSDDDNEREKDRKKEDKDPCGAPLWSVNMISMNLFVTDTPLWFKNPVGPSIEITLSYNSQSSIAYNQPFGNKWIFGYASYLIVDTGGQVNVFMPDGRHDLYSPDGAGGYLKPLGLFNTLTKIEENHFLLTFPDGTVYEYDIPYGTASLQPFLVKITDRYGQSLKLLYATHGSVIRLQYITDALGRPTMFSYENADYPGLVTGVRDPAGRTASFGYDGSGNLIRITDMGGYETSFTYDKDVYLTSIGNARGTWAFSIEPSDGVVANSDNYPPPGDLMWANYRITVTDPTGAKEEYMYYAGCDSEERDEGGCVGRSWHVSPKDYIEWQSQTFNNYRLRVPKTKYFFTTVNGKRGRISSVRYPDGGTVRYTYTATGQPETITDPHGHTTSFGYNAMGFKTSITDAKQQTTTMTYDVNDIDLLSISDGLGTTTMAHDDRHNITSLTDHLNNTTEFTYDGYGRITSLTNPLGQVTNFIYYDLEMESGDRGQLREITKNGAALSTFTYDLAGRIKTRTDASGITLTFAYDHLNRVTDIGYPDGKHESFVYSGCCPRLVDSHTGRNGLTTRYAYDAMERVKEIRNPDATVIRYEYDLNGNLTKQIDTNGNTTTFSYDVMDRLIRKTYTDGISEEYKHDETDLLIEKTNARGTTATYTYDQNHNLLAVAYSDGSPGIDYVYDDYNRAVSRTDGTGAYHFTHDAGSRMVSIDGPWDNDTLTFSYDAIGRIASIQQQGGETITHAYDAFGRVTGISNGAGSFIYSYPPSTATPLPVSLTRPNGSQTFYEADGLGRLKVITSMNSSQGVINANEFTYNQADLRGSETVTSGEPATSFTDTLVTYEYNHLNQILAATSPARAFSFDKDGNMTKGYTPEGYIFSAAYDAENRLQSLEYTDGNSVGHHIDYQYAGNGLLARQIVDGVERRFIRNGYLVLQERDGANSVTRSYLWGRSMGGGVGGLLEVRQEGQRYNYLYDGKGNVSALIDSSQNVVAAYTYDAFGNLLQKSGVLDQPYTFSTKPSDESTGLSYFGRRFYSPAVKRWLTRDPIGERGGINLYGFAGNNPVNNVDAFGQWYGIAPAPQKPVVYTTPVYGWKEAFLMGLGFSTSPKGYQTESGDDAGSGSACLEALKDKGEDAIDVFSPEGPKVATTVASAGKNIIEGAALGVQGAKIIGDYQGRDLLGTGKKNPLGICEQAKDWGPAAGAVRRECGF